MELLLVRHGRTAWNSSGRFQGRSDIPLSPEGIAQARAAAEALADDPIDAAFSSDLIRAASTAEAILFGRAVPLAFDVRLREFDFGAWEGRTWAEIVEEFPAAGGTALTSARDYHPQGGETFADVRLRVRAWLNERAPYDERRILVVAHAGTLHALLAELLGRSFDAMTVRFSHASITRIEYVDGRARILTLDDTAHLRAPSVPPEASPSLRRGARQDD
ncbi:MAG: histidine phosphatase family protein [Candidatus Eremiobacteraeota bacterium]|nr:histidine phosphatase family protein [Candidatus Eremiobacteraeota bacterium]NNM93513.1 histidine phosphatase family protein [Candidatus Eremiobacteraeota bacterium]